MNGFWMRVLCLLVGYLFGSFMTAELVTQRLTGKPCSELGKTGNPGMANVMANLGFVPGIIVLAGDLLKCLIPCVLCGILCGPAIGRAAVMITGLGVTLGHDFPLLQPSRGGKGVSVSCLAIFLASPLWGLIADVAGMLTVFVSKYLCLGGVVIPAVFIIPAFAVMGPECGFIAIILFLLSFYKHWPALREIPSGNAEKTDVLYEIRSHLKKKEGEDD